MLVITISFCYCDGQNLVLNGDFESHTACPLGATQIYYANNWQSPSLTGTPDYYNTCAVYPAVGVPDNFAGYQFAHSGNAYAGVDLYQTIPFNWEYITGELSDNLIAGKCYHFEMYVSVADFVQYATDDIGVYFSNTIFSVADAMPLTTYLPVVNNPSGIFPDTTGWTLVSGNFVATGGERYLTIGNFKSQSNTTLSVVNSTAMYTDVSYFYVDDISVTSLSSLITTTPVTLCAFQLPYTWNGNTYNSSGLYYDTLVNTTGCDSVVALDLHVTLPATSTTSISICSSQLPFVWNGYTYNSTGVYNVLLTAGSGCDSIATLNLDVLPEKRDTADVTICSSSLPYSWNGHDYNSGGNYSTLLTGTTGCDSISVLHLTVNPVPEINLGNDTTICNGKSISFDVAITGASYLWQDGTLNSFHNIISGGTYWVKINLNGCETTDTIKIDTKDCDCVPLISNAFTPNGDGVNDQWIIARGHCNTPIIVSVYNRYGTLVYHSDNYQDDWRGTYRNKNCPDGTYYYVIKLAHTNQKEQIFKGNVTILR